MSYKRHITRRTLIAGAVTLGASLTGISTATANPPKPSTPTSPPPTVQIGPEWTLIPALSDNFANSSSSSRWKRGLWYPTSKAGTFNDNNVTFANGALQLSAKREGNSYSFGAVESTFDLPGICTLVEFRARALDRRANVLSAIWLQSSNHDHVDRLLTGADPHPEIDIMETFSFSQMNMATHTWASTGHIAHGGKNYETGLPDISAAYHTYGLERRDGKLRFYFDRKLAWETPAPHPSMARMSRHAVLSLEGHLGAPNPQFLPAAFHIDYLRTYYHTATTRPDPGKYRIVNAANGNGLTVKNGALTDVAGAKDTFTIERLEDFTYHIRHTDSATMLTLHDGRGQIGVPVDATTYAPTTVDSAGSWRRWHIHSTPGGTYSICSRFSGLALANTNGRLTQQEPANEKNQHWKLERA
ncbi:Kappa-carrageenase precursor [Dermatophilus congolensis]|uniref:Kappa-carrageenase n=1 Tax=Dermatophilus congolensis TaxID=1863 RepID=A0AA46H1I8_9MICO|nr:family 16 glycosylhydrolase [Dermatophilus congolensis]STD15579.1 Kappa-carrageenase precursor [Dermatophilus congolensis]